MLTPNLYLLIPNSSDCSRAFALAPRQHADRHEGLHAQRGPSVGTRHTIQLRGVAEGHVPASQGLTKRSPPEKGIANHFSILASR